MLFEKTEFHAAPVDLADWAGSISVSANASLMRLGVRHTSAGPDSYSGECAIATAVDAGRRC